MVKMQNDHYEKTAHHYDPAYAAQTSLNDIPFYVDLAKSINGATLEIGCGTGRILLPTARTGIKIDGLDFSSSFLAVLKKKLKSEAPDLQARVSLHQGDMRNFALDKTYDLITVPFRPLQHLYTVDDQLAAFRCFNSHLKAGGTLAFNVFYPNFKVIDEVGVEKMEVEWVDSQDTSITVRRSFLRKSVNNLHQYFEGEFIFRSYREERLINEERSSISMSFYTYPQILLLLKGTGFKVTAEYGSYDKEPISICKEMIFIAEKEQRVPST